MKINIISILAPLASAALFTGCTKTAAPEYSWSTDPDAVRIEASVGALTKTNPFDNAEKQKQFNGPDANGKFLGDEIAVSMVDNSGQVEKTVTYRFDAEVWNPVPATDYLVWKSPVTYKAWYPASSKDGFTLPTDQSESLTENYGNSAKADFMTGEYVCDSKIPTDHKLKLVMQRKMALVTVNVDKTRLKNQFEGKNIYKINVESIQSGYSTVSSDGTGSGNPVDVKPGPTNIAYDNNAGKGVYHAIVVPCDGDASAQFLKVTVSWTDDDNPMGYTPPPFVVTGRPTFEAGKHYTYNLTIGKDKVEAGDITVSNWGRTVDLNDGKGEFDADKAPDPVSVSDLRKQLEDWNKANPENKKELKDLITKELLDENCKNGKLIISGEFDNTTPAYTSTSRTCYGMSVETLEAFEKIAEYVRDKNNKVSCLDLSGVTGLTAIGKIEKEKGSEEYNLSFCASGLVTFIGSPDITAIGYAFERNNNLVSVSGLENVTYARSAFSSCRSLSVVPYMPKATNFRYTFSDTAIKELCHKNVEVLTITECEELTVIDCPRVNYLISHAFSSPLPKLTELRLTSDFFDIVHVEAFEGTIKAECSLWLNANQEKNITKDGNVIAWTPKKSDGSTSAVDNSGAGNQGKTSISLEGFKAVYCGDKPIK